MNEVIRQILTYGFICGSTFGAFSLFFGYCLSSVLGIYRNLIK